ncbi:MAG: isocitrate/isopropylmalate dehydrogenase family protein [Bryobacterales bacterium]|nr:isocitrate/isopropylmalate dehydrogenase family protein [Bryobacterales bacterium]
MRTYKIAVLPGDGIGPEVTREALRVLRAVESAAALRFEFKEYACGAGEYLRNGDPLPAATLEACRAADATLLGAMGLPDVRWPSGTEMAPQLDIREQLDLYAGVRPIYLYHEAHSPLKGYRTGEIDFVIFRENTEGMFASRKNATQFDAEEQCDTLRITRKGAARIARAAFREAEKRRGLCTLVDKANVLPSMAYFRHVFDAVAREFPTVRAEHVYVDAASLYLVKNPRRFDVLVMENLFGDILSDLGAGLVGGMGMAPSADVGDEHGLFQPSHGSAPDIAGQGIANPVATILSAAMMLEWLGGEEAQHGAALIRAAVAKVCGDPANLTPDLGGTVGTVAMGEKIVAALESAA